jgi:predicted DNA-binding protein
MSSVRQLLMSAARRIGGPGYPEMIEEMERELNEVIEDFSLAVNVEALRVVHETSKLSFSQPVDK